MTQGATPPPPPARPREERDRLVLDNLPLVHWAVLRFAPGTFPDTDAYDELLSVGHLALLKAATHFDESRGFRFSTYAASCLLRAMPDARRQAGLDAAARLPRESEDAPAGSAVVDPWADDPADVAEADELADAVDDALRRLPPRTRDVLVRRFWGGQLLDQVGRALGVTRSRAQQIEARALRRLATSCPHLAGHLPA